MLTLKRANLSRGHWSDDDYDVYDGERVIGRIMLHPQAPKDQPWFWTITARRRTPSTSDRGYSANREQAMADFKARWKRQGALLVALAGFNAPRPAGSD